MRPSTSLAPHQAIRQKHAPKSPIPLSVLKLIAPTVLQSLWNLHLWVSESPFSLSSSLLQDLGYVVRSLHVVVQGNMRVLHWIIVECRKAHTPRKWLLSTSFLEAKVYSVSIPATVQHSRHLPLIRAWFDRSPHISISSLLTPFPQPAQLPSSLPKGTWRNPDFRATYLLPYTPALMAES